MSCLPGKKSKERGANKSNKNLASTIAIKESASITNEGVKIAVNSAATIASKKAANEEGKRTVSDEFAKNPAATKANEEAGVLKNQGTKKIEEGGPSSSKRKETVFDTPPKDYNIDVFKINFPFVGVVETKFYSENWPLDKVGDGSTMDREALLAAVGAMVNSTTVSACAYKRPKTESVGRIIHGSLAMDLWMVTSPSPEPRMRTLEDVLAASVRRPANLLVKLAEDQEDVVLKIGEMMMLEGDSSTESAAIVHEEDERAYNDTRADLRFLVRDKRMKIDDNLVLVLLVECKWDGLSRNVIFQAAAYVAKKYALKNMCKGRFDPIYLQAWAEKLWCYGIFYPLGIVEIQGGKVVSTTSLTIEEMEITLKAARQELRNLNGDKMALYPDGTYISGTLYVPHERIYLLPDMREEGGAASAGAKRFFQSLLRIVIGEKVLKWTVDDANRAVEIRAKMIEDAKQKALKGF